MNTLLVAAAAFALLSASAAAQSAEASGDAARGETVYRERCAACHSLDANRVGPAHRGVYGRRAGAAPGYAYSKALRESGVVWNEETLDRWLQNPEAFIPGQRMNYRLSDAELRGDVIAYLRTQPAASAEKTR